MGLWWEAVRRAAARTFGRTAGAALVVLAAVGALGAAGSPVTAVAPPAAHSLGDSGQGYWLIGGDGGVFAFGEAPYDGSESGQTLSAPIVGMAEDPATGGYWMVGSNGAVYSFDAPYDGGLGATTVLNGGTVVGIAATGDGGGYWLVSSSGYVYAFGDANYYGSCYTDMPATSGPEACPSPVVAIVPSHDGGGYWLFDTHGDVYSFGDAVYHGGLGGLAVTNIVSVAPTPDGGGYWMLGSNGSVYSYGDAVFAGSEAATSVPNPWVGMASTPDGGGYWVAASDGGVVADGSVSAVGSPGIGSPGDAVYLGGENGTTLNKPIVGIVPYVPAAKRAVVAQTATSAPHGYTMFSASGGVFNYNSPYINSVSGYSGETAQKWLGGPIVDGVEAPNGAGYWVLDSTGDICNFGPVNVENDAGSGGAWQWTDADWCWPRASGMQSGIAYVGMAPTNNSNGYWITDSAGDLYTFGTAAYDGSPSYSCAESKVDCGLTTIIGIVSTPDGGGYWMFGSDGGVYTYGDAKFEGSCGPGSSTGRCAANVVAMIPNPASPNAGYALIDSHGDVYNYGTSGYHGSLGLNACMVGAFSTPDGGGYGMANCSGYYMPFGDSQEWGSASTATYVNPSGTVVAVSRYP